MIIIEEQIDGIQGFTEDHLWFLFKLAKIIKTYKNTHPKIETLCKWTGWSRQKVVNIIGQLEKLGMIEVQNRTKKTGGLSSNSYKLKTKLVKWDTSLEDVNAVLELDTVENTDSNEENTPKSPGNTAVYNLDDALSKNHTDNITNSNSLYIPPTKEKEKLEEIKTKLYHDINLLAIEKSGLTSEQIDQLILEKFHLHKGYSSDMIVGKVISAFLYRKADIDRQKTKWSPNMATSKPDTSENTSVYPLILSQYDDESDEDFKARIEAKEAEGRRVDAHWRPPDKNTPTGQGLAEFAAMKAKIFENSKF